MYINTLSKFLIIPLLLLSSTICHSSLSLSTNSRYIVSPSGERFKLRCVNWAGHNYAMIPEGLHERPLKDIAETISTTGFNCVRLTWAVKMYTQFQNLTVEQSLTNLNLTSAKDGINKNNPKFLSMTLLDVRKEVIDELGANNLVVILDNHVSEPMWCCGADDGNGFFGDKFFDPQEWLQAWGIVAAMYKGNPTVVGMSLRNELRGPKENEEQWYEYMQQGAEVINKNNPDVLVIVSGLGFDIQLQFLKNKPFNVSFKSKLVFEAHWYPFGNSLERWKYHTNEMCSSRTNEFIGASGFLLTGSNSFPLFLSEFGLDMRGIDEMSNFYFTCLLAYTAETDIDWAYWALQGNYMLRESKQNDEEFYGIVTGDWGSVRNATMLQKLQMIQQITQDGSKTDTGYNIMYHPESGSCVHTDSENKVSHGDCKSVAKWSYDKDNHIKLVDGAKCLAATGDGLPVTLSSECSGNQTIWKKISVSNLHLAATDKSGNLLCLDRDTKSSAIITTKCLCLDDTGKDVARCEQNPQIQWFKLVPTNIK